MGALSFSMIDHEIAFGLCFNLPKTQKTSSQLAYFPRPTGL